jgi:hypothetical protein
MSASNRDIALKIGQRWEYSMANRKYFICEVTGFIDHKSVSVRVVQSFDSYKVGTNMNQTFTDECYNYLPGQDNFEAVKA